MADSANQWDKQTNKHVQNINGVVQRAYKTI